MRRRLKAIRRRLTRPPDRSANPAPASRVPDRGDEHPTIGRATYDAVSEAIRDYLPIGIGVLLVGIPALVLAGTAQLFLGSPGWLTVVAPAIAGLVSAFAALRRRR